MRKIAIILVAVGLLAGAGLATRPPGNDSTETAVAKATDVSVGVLLSAARTNETDNHVLLTSIKIERGLWGTLTNGIVQARYREFMIREIPAGMSVCFADYTGSGFEWDAKTNLSYVCFFHRQTNGMSLLRLEPLANESKIREVFEKLKKTEPQQGGGHVR
jgi:hypothetical protein